MTSPLAAKIVGATPEMTWSLAPVAVAVLTIVGLVYWLRWRALSSRHPREMGLRLGAFMGGLLVLIAAMTSPLARLGEQLVAFHTLQHILVTDIGPILVLLGLAPSLLAPVMPVLRRCIPHPAIAVALYAGTIAVWHIPRLYEAAVEQPWVHAIQHASLIAAGLLFWWHVLSPVPFLRRVRGMAVATYMVIAKLLTGAVASILAFAPSPLFGYYAALPRFWDIDAIQDQQVAGTLMMSEQAIAMTTAFCFMFFRMLGESQEQPDVAVSDRG